MSYLVLMYLSIKNVVFSTSVLVNKECSISTYVLVNKERSNAVLVLMYLSIRNVLCECDCLLAPWGKKLNKTLKPYVRTATRTKRRRTLLYPITEHYT